MPIRVTAMKRVQEDGQKAKVLFIDTLYHLPRVGDIIQKKDMYPYEVIQVIIRNTDVVLEVKEYVNQEIPLITRLTTL